MVTNIMMILLFRILTLVGFLPKKDQPSLLRTHLEAIYVFSTQFVIGYFVFGMHAVYFFLYRLSFLDSINFFHNQVNQQNSWPIIRPSS